MSPSRTGLPEGKGGYLHRQGAILRGALRSHKEDFRPKTLLEGDPMDNQIPARARLEPARWLLILTGILVVIVPWWLGLLWIFGLVR